MVVKLAEETLNTKYGEFREVLFSDGKTEIIALVKGDVNGKENILCRVHSSCISAHAFNGIECNCREQMEMTQEMIKEEGKGVIIWMEHEGKGNGHLALMKSKAFKRSGMLQGDAYEAAGYKRDARDFSSAPEILVQLGVRSVKLITDNPDKAKTLTNGGIKVSAVQSLIP